MLKYSALLSFEVCDFLLSKSGIWIIFIEGIKMQKPSNARYLNSFQLNWTMNEKNTLKAYVPTPKLLCNFNKRLFTCIHGDHEILNLSC